MSGQSRAAMVLGRFAQAAESLRACRSLAPVVSTSGRGLQTSAPAQQQPAPASDMIEVTVNGEPVQIPKGSTVMAACATAGVDIPR